MKSVWAKSVQCISKPQQSERLPSLFNFAKKYGIIKIKNIKILELNQTHQHPFYAGDYTLGKTHKTIYLYTVRGKKKSLSETSVQVSLEVSEEKNYSINLSSSHVLSRM